MPIMAASSVPKVGTVTARLMKSTVPNAIASANRAVRMGRPMAMTEPKASSRMTIAARMPTPSLAPKANFWILAMGDPPRMTEIPGPAPCWARLTTAWMAAFGRVGVPWSNWTSP